MLLFGVWTETSRIACLSIDTRLCQLRPRLYCVTVSMSLSPNVFSPDHTGSQVFQLYNEIDLEITLERLSSDYTKVKD